MQNLSEHAYPALRHFSGTLTYAKTFQLASSLISGAPDRRLLLDLGAVGVIAEVSLNGQTFQPLWKPPFRVDVTQALRPGENTLVVRVANTWRNRMKLDVTLPPAERLSWSTLYNDGALAKSIATADLPPSGLIGPVRVIAENIQPLEARSP